MDKGEMDKRVCLLLGVPEENRELISQITRAFVLSMAHQLAVGGNILFEDLGGLSVEGDGVVFEPNEFFRNLTKTYKVPGG